MREGKQARSWSHVYGVKEERSLVAQIYFPTASATLDEQDRSVLDSLIGHYRIALLGNRIDLKFVGRADHRGDVEYNRKLGMERAKAVQAYVNKALHSTSRFFSTKVVSLGETGASRIDLAGDRRVDVFSSYIPRRPPIQLPPITVVGSLPKRQVKRPVQFVDIEVWRLVDPGPHEDAGTSHEIVIEQYGMFDEDHTVPCCSIIVSANKVHGIFPPIQVRRSRIGWRKSRTGDTARSAAKTALEIISGILDTAGGWDFGEGVPDLKPPNIVYPSWDAYIKRNGHDEYVKTYRGPF